MVPVANRPTETMHETTRFDIETLPRVKPDVRISIVRIFGGNALQVWQAKAGSPQFFASIRCNPAVSASGSNRPHRCADQVPALTRFAFSSEPSMQPVEPKID